MSEKEEARVLVVFITCPLDDTPQKLAHHLIDNRLAACVNIIPQVRSIYRWQGKVCDDGEALLVVKSTAPMLAALIAAVKAQHPYTVPEVIALPVAAGNPEYLAWVVESIKP